MVRYRSAWERFDTWFQEAHLTALPTTPQTVAMFIAAEAYTGKANATLEHRLAAIRVVHLRAGEEILALAEKIASTPSIKSWQWMTKSSG